MYKPGARVVLKNMETYVNEDTLFVGCKGTIIDSYINGSPGSYHMLYPVGTEIVLFRPDGRHGPLSFDASSVSPMKDPLNRRSSCIM